MNDYTILKISIAVLLVFIIGFIIYLSITYTNCQKKYKEDLQIASQNNPNNSNNSE